MDGMVYASIQRPPVLGGKVKSFDDKEALKVAGVSQTVSIDPFEGPWGFQPLGGVAVIANSTWAAFQGRKSLKVEWDNGPNASYNSDAYKKELQQTARSSAKVVRNQGDVDGAFAKGGKIIEAEYYVPHLAHAAMEPLVAVADYRDGKSNGLGADAKSAGRAGNGRQGSGNFQGKCDLPRDAAWAAASDASPSPTTSRKQRFFRRKWDVP